MPKTITRRELLKFTGGGILGLMFSPFPWKLLDDSAIWTQNWSLTPSLSHGPITSLISRCPLCPSGCAVKAHCVSGTPFALSGIPSADGGALCPRGLAAHHMPHHPLRIAHPHRFIGDGADAHLTAVPYTEAIDAIAAHLKSTSGRLAFFDRRPGRAASELYARFAEAYGNGIVTSSPADESRTLQLLRTMLGQSAPLAFDVTHASLIVSFGAPLLDGWGTLAVMTKLRNNGSTQFIQIEPRYSRTAHQADQWVPVAPGTERLAALSLASVLLEERLVPSAVLASIRDLAAVRKQIAPFTPEATSPVTGIEPSLLRSVARTISRASSAVIIGGTDPGGGPLDIETERAIAALNIFTGNVGRTGGIVLQHPLPQAGAKKLPASLSEVPDHSLSTLFIDGDDAGYAVPWKFIERKLSNDAMVISFSPILDPLTVHADLLLPTAAPFETMTMLTGGADRPTATFALSTPLMPPHHDAVTISAVLKDIVGRLGIMPEFPTEEEVQRAAIAAIFTQQRGTVHSSVDGTSSALNSFASEEEFRAALETGAEWSDEPMPQPRRLSFTLGFGATEIPAAAAPSLMLLATGWKGAVSSSQVSPILSKIFQESDLRPTNGIVSVNPVTARALGVSKDRPAHLSTIHGSAEVRIVENPAVPPGIAEAAIGPALNGTETPAHPSSASLLDLCDVTAEGTWKLTPAQFLKA